MSCDVIELVTTDLLVELVTEVDVLEISTPGPQGPAGLPGEFESFPFTYQGALEPYTSPMRLYLDANYTLDALRASVGSAPLGSPVQVELLVNGASTLTPVSIPSGAHTASVHPVAVFVPGDYLSVAITQVGSIVAGADLVVIVRLRYTTA